jgi:hypothetical protein
MHNIDEFIRQFLRLAEGEDVSKPLIALAMGLTTSTGIVRGLFREFAARRVKAAAAARAEREIAQHRRLHEPSSVRLVFQPDGAGCLMSFIAPTLGTDLSNEIGVWLPSGSKASPTCIKEVL